MSESVDLAELRHELTDESKALLDDLTNWERRDVRLRYGWSREEIEPRLLAIEAEARQAATREALSVERLVEATVVATRSVAMKHWPWLRGDGWPAYEEQGEVQVLRVNEYAAAILAALDAK